MTAVHPTAAIDPGAVVGHGLRAGAYSVVEAGAVLAEGCVLGPHAVVLAGAVLAEGCAVHPFAVVGGDPQDRSYRAEATRAVLGRAVVVREHATIHRGTARGGGETRVGAGTMVMVGAHVAHDCDVGEGVVLANGVQLAGHVVVEPWAVFGGLAAVAQCLRVGEGAMVAAGSMVETDVPPWHVVSGDRARVRGLNTVGLARRGVATETVRELTALHRALYRAGRPLAVALGEVTVGPGSPRELVHLVRFLEASLASPRRRTGRLVVP